MKMKIKFIEEKVSKDQINWGGHSDPSGVLEVGKEYELDRAEVHSQHTKIFLKEFPGKSWNSVWFDIDDVMKLPQ